MPGLTSGVALLFAATAAALTIAAAPAAVADSCDPSVTVCQGNEVQTGPPVSAAPVVATGDDQYPYDDEWYFNPAGGGTALQPNNASHSGGGSGGGGGGGHR